MINPTSIENNIYFPGLPKKTSYKEKEYWRRTGTGEKNANDGRPCAFSNPNLRFHDLKSRDSVIVTHRREIVGTLV